MAHDIEKIMNLLDDIQRTNNMRADSLDRSLSAISSKLDISSREGGAELLKAYISELSKSVDDKYSNTLYKIEDIEKALKAIYDSQDNSVKGSDLKDLFEILSKNINNFYTEARQQKAIISGIESKISDISNNKTDKEDIMRTISLLRNDFGNINASYKSSFDDISSTLKTILSTIKSVDPLNTGKTVITQIDIMFKSIHEIATTLQDVSDRESEIEKILVNVVTNEELKITQGIIDSIIEKTNEIGDKLATAAQKSDIEELNRSIDTLYQSQISQNNISEQTENIQNQAEEIKQTLSKVAQHIDNIPDASELSSGLIKLHEQIEILGRDINTADNTADIAAMADGIRILKEEFDTIKNIIIDFNEVISGKVANMAESASFDTSDFKQIILDLSEKFPQPDEISQILSENQTLNEINEKTNYISKQLDILPAIKENVEDLVHKLPNVDIREEISTIYNKTNSIENWLKKSGSDIKIENTAPYSESSSAFERLHKKLDSMRDDIEDVKGFGEKILRNNSDVENNIASISEFLKNNSPADEQYVKNELDEIKSMIEANVQDIDNIEDPDITSIKDYLDQIKELINLNSNGDLYSKLLSIEDSIVNNHTFNESAFSQILEKINNFKYSSNSDTDNQIGNAINELISMRSQIDSLQKQFDNNFSGSSDNTQDIYSSRIEEFISDKLSDINNNLTQITNCVGEKLEQGFTYQADLLEQKTAKLQEFIEQLSSEKNISADLDNKLSGAGNILDDFRQELQFASTDISDGIAKNTSDILNEIMPIKEMIGNISKNISSDGLKKEVEEFNDTLVSAPELSEIRTDIEDLYGRLTEKFTENENNIKDFVLTDTDSIIIKLDNLRDYVEKTLDSFVPPDTDNMKELNEFIKNINDFKESQAQLLSLTAEEIKQEIITQSDEIKSLITVANNHDAIIAAIEDLKKSFKSAKTKAKSKTESTEEAVYNEDLTAELKEEFEKYTKIIEKLSDDNTQIKEILTNIGERIDKAPLNNSNEKISEGSEITDDDFEISDEDIFGNDKFDIVQAFDILQHDISELKDSIDEVKNDTDDKNSLKIPSINNSGVMMSVNSKLDEVLKSLNSDWLKDVQKYIETSKISMDEKLNSIESKLDIFVSDSTNTDILNDVSDTLNEITDSVAGITPRLDEIVPRLEEITPVIEEKLTESDKKLSTMLEELNQKIGLIGNGTNSEELNDIKSLIGEQKNYIEKLEPSEKLEAFKKCLDEISFEVNALATDSNADNAKLDKTIKEMKESLMSAVITIFDQVSFVEESEDIKDFVEERTDEINQNIALITQQLKQLSSSGETQNYTYTMQDIETDLAKLRLALKELQDNKEPEKVVDFSEITEKLHSINSSVDLLTQDEIKELKSEISELKEQTQFLIATSDKSYDAINTGIEGFGEKLNENLSDKVDKLSKMLENSAQSDKVIKQALIYMGEWIDSASQSINKISSNSEEISNINNVIKEIEDLKSTISLNTNDTIEQKIDNWSEQIKSLENKFSKMENLESQLTEQQDRIDRLEKNIDKILDLIENLEDPGVSRKIDKIEKQISKLGTNIEKLASYVD